MSEITELTPTTALGDAVPPLRAQLRADALERALAKRSAGVPSYTVPEAAALLSVSYEHLHRLIRAEEFPVVRVGGRYVVPAQALERILTPEEAGTEDPR